MSETLAYLTGGPCDGGLVPVEFPLGLHMAVMDAGGRLSTVAYRPARRLDADGFPLYEFDSWWSSVLVPVPGDEDEPAPLESELVACLDWPLGFTYGVHCDKQDCTSGSCDARGSGMVTGRDFGTVRELLADIRAHAEETSGS